MRLFTVLFFAIIFFSVAILGSLGMGHEAEAHHHGCLAATAQSASCPEVGSVESAIFHIGFLKVLNSALVYGFVVLSIVMLCAMIAGIFSSGKESTYKALTLFSRKIFGFFAPKITFIHWLSLLEHSPAYI